MRWYDNRAVQLSSTNSGIEPILTVKRWDRKQHMHIDVQCPAIVSEYNYHMGGVDKFDMLAALYPVDHKSVKWYRRIFLWVLSVATINGWLLYRRHCFLRQIPSRDQFDLLSFIARISESLIKNEKPLFIERKRGRPALSTASSSASLEALFENSSNEEISTDSKKKIYKQRDVPLKIRYDHIDHIPTHKEPKQRCRVCKSHVRMACMKCDVYLCIKKDKNCFLANHTQ